jgi:hypothetical protein
VISIRNEPDETRLASTIGAEVILTETRFSIRIGGQGWGAGIAYRAPRLVATGGQRVMVRDYVLLARLVSLVLIILCMTLRRTSK